MFLRGIFSATELLVMFCFLRRAKAHRCSVDEELDSQHSSMIYVKNPRSNASYAEAKTQSLVSNPTICTSSIQWAFRSFNKSGFPLKIDLVIFSIETLFLSFSKSLI